MPKVFQIVGDRCYWQTPYTSVAETVGKYPEDCKFVEAPDYVFESWGYLETDMDGNQLTGDDRFIKPTPPEGWVYDDKMGTFYPESEIEIMLEAAKNDKQNINKRLLAEYLSNHPITWTDGKLYGVTLEDQTEIQLNMSQYQVQLDANVEEPILEWHAIHEANVPWTYENLSALVASIREHIQPWLKKMNRYKSQIFNASTREEVYAIELVYEDPSEE